MSKHKGFWIPLEYMELDITWTQRILMSEISQLEILKAGCVASNAHFADKLRISPQGVSKALNSLKEKGLIDIDNSHTKRNFGRTITINCGKSAINCGLETIDSKPYKSSVSTMSMEEEGSKKCGKVDVKYIEYVFEELWKQQYKAIRNLTDRGNGGKKQPTRTAFKTMWKNIARISDISGVDFANYISGFLSEGYAKKKDGNYYIPNFITVIPTIETEIEIQFEELENE